MLFITIFSAAVLVIFADILFLRQTFIWSDYMQQFFPWSKLYSESIKTGHLALWIKEVQCGFPLFAESQIGQLYPLNLLFFFLLPFKMAYNYSFLFHFALAGVFTYFFSRTKGADAWGGALSAVLVCFGSVYAGCFINTSVLKSLAWFPLVLLLYDKYSLSGKRKWALAIGLILGIQFLAGAVQMTAYAAFFYLIYFLYVAIEKRKPLVPFIMGMLMIGSVAFLIALPQLSETSILAALSNRSSRTLDFALWSSFSPLSFIGSVVPYTGIAFTKGKLLYIGVLGLFFALAAIWLSRTEKDLRPLVLFFIISVFLALGKYNPLYVLLVKLSGFYSFRAPSRFIYFGVFALAILAGRGLTFFCGKGSMVPAPVYRLFGGIIAAAVGFFVASKVVISLFGGKILDLAIEYVKKNVYDKPFHRYSMDEYIDKVRYLYGVITDSLSLGDPRVLAGICIMLCAAGFIYVAGKVRYKGNPLRLACMAFVALELAVFGTFSKGLWPEVDHWSYIEPLEKKTYMKLLEDKGIFRVCPFVDFNKAPWWLRASVSAYYGIDSVAIYTPLTNSDYFDRMYGLGVVDDSIGVVAPENGVLYKELDYLRGLNVKYVISINALEDPSLRYLFKENKLYLYELEGYLQRLRFNGPGRSNVEVRHYGSGIAELTVENTEKGRLIFAEKYYPGWRAFVDGRETTIAREMDILQSIELLPGRHEVVFRYFPWYLGYFIMVSAVVFFGILMFVMFDRQEVKT